MYAMPEEVKFSKPVSLYFGLPIRIPMSEVISFKVSKEIKEKYEKLKDVIDWPAELRAFVEERIRKAEITRVIRKILEKKTREVLPRGAVVAAIREDREGD